MERIKNFTLVIGLFWIGFLNAQTTQITGKVTALDEVEGIHIINKTASKFTITDQFGHFTIPAKLQDTIVFSAVNYKPQKIIVTRTIMESKILSVQLIELVNELDEVVVGKILTGNLSSDIANSDAKRDIDFYDLGIPGYTGLPATQSQQRLNDADHGKMIYYYGLLATVNVNKLLNKISGRTKMLKNRVELETKETCMESIRSNLGETFFASNDLEENLQTEFFYYCSEDEEFLNLCKINNDYKTFEFLKEKLISYKANLQVKKE